MYHSGDEMDTPQGEAGLDHFFFPPSDSGTGRKKGVSFIQENSFGTAIHTLDHCLYSLSSNQRSTKFNLEGSGGTEGSGVEKIKNK